jgi:hypothetical protein
VGPLGKSDLDPASAHGIRHGNQRLATLDNRVLANLEHKRMSLIHLRCPIGPARLFL